MNAVTVFCAVWHKDPHRHALLQSHRENLRRQSLAADIVYIFDGGDTPPEGLEAQAIVAREPLTVYQAWNLALAAVRTPLVMNLNLDDRLAPDAIQALAWTLDQTGADLVGGDWRVCFSREETDAVTPCVAAASLPPLQAWPPPAGVAAALGSSLEGRTMGPATLWRMEVHQAIPRYPWRLRDGALVRTIGDALFWEALRAQGRTLHRLPAIIGNYHSHPGEQAEFRNDARAEIEAAKAVGASLL